MVINYELCSWIIPLAKTKLLPLQLCTTDVTLLSTTQVIGELDSVQCTKRESCVLLKILANLWSFLSYKEFPSIHGQNDKESNFIQLFKLRWLDNSTLAGWSHQSRDKYLNPEIQNEMLDFLLVTVMWSIAEKLQSSHMFSIIANECVDMYNKDRLTIFFHCVGTNLEDLHREFVGFYQVSNMLKDNMCMCWRTVSLGCNYSGTGTDGKTSGTCLKWSPMGQKYLTLIERWLV